MFFANVSDETSFLATLLLAAAAVVIAVRHRAPAPASSAHIPLPR
jgi:hypothetical protein